MKNYILLKVLDYLIDKYELECIKIIRLMSDNIEQKELIEKKEKYYDRVIHLLEIKIDILEKMI